MNIAIVLRKSPYGDINAAEALRHAMGGVADELDISLILLDSGVLLAKKGHDAANSGFTNLEGALSDCIGMGIKVYADKASVREHHLDVPDMVDGIKMVGSSEIADILKEAKTAMIF